MKWVKPDRARVTYYNAEGKVIEVREHPVKDMGTYSVVDPGDPPKGAAFQHSQAVIVPSGERAEPEEGAR